MLITALLIVGRKDILDIRNKTNLLKIIISSILMTIVTVIVKDYIGQNTAIITLGIFAVIWIIIFKIHWVEAYGSSNCFGYFYGIRIYNSCIRYKCNW